MSDGQENSSKDVNININNIGDVKIKYAIYSSSNTSTVEDDKIYIYFDQEINPNTILSDTSSNYVITGVGAIGSNSSTSYNSTFLRHTISLDNNGTQSSIFEINATKISLANNAIEDINGDYITDTNEVTIERLNPIIGSIGHRYEYDKFNDKIVIERFIDNGDRTISYKSHNLMWQNQRDMDTKYSWNDAVDYCSNLSLAGFDDWRLPSIHELVQIIDRNETTKQQFDSGFSTINAERYLSFWSKDVLISDDTKAWYFDVRSSIHDSVIKKTSSLSTMCVRYAY